jgi:homoserine O-acetyltransferase/O-succinyltransferase
MKRVAWAGAVMTVLLGILAGAGVCAAQDFGATAVAGDFVVKNFRFHDGETMPEVKLHYVTWGTPRKNAAGEITNAVLLIHGTGGQGLNFAGNAGENANAFLGGGGPVDTKIFYVIAPDTVGSGHSSKPSHGLRQKFPHYNLEDAVALEKLLVESLGAHHLALVSGISLGGRMTWQWVVQYPDFMDAAVPMIASPKPNAGRRGMIDFLAEAIVRNDPNFEDGNYTKNPKSAALAISMYGMWLDGAAGLQEDHPTRELSEKAIEQVDWAPDANDFIYQVRMNDGFDAWSQIEKVRAPMLLINLAGDQMVPIQLGDAKAAAAKLKEGTYLQVEEGAKYGHGGLTATMNVWAPKMRAWLEAHEPQEFSH